MFLSDDDDAMVCGNPPNATKSLKPKHYDGDDDDDGDDDGDDDDDDDDDHHHHLVPESRALVYEP